MPGNARTTDTIGKSYG